MDNNLIIKKVLNNNVLISDHPAHNEVVLIGKGIGFGKKKGDSIDVEVVDKTFILEDQKEQEQYKKLLPQLDENFIELMNDIIFYIKSSLKIELNGHIHVALTDHIAFAIKRMKEGMTFHNPFLIETKTFYPEEYKVAEGVVHYIYEQTNVQLPEDEIGFVALHIHSATSKKTISEINQHSHLISKLTDIIERSLQIELDRTNVQYLRLIRHLRYTIDRVEQEEEVTEPKKLALVLKEEYPICYNIAWKLIKVIQQTLKKPVDESETIYLTLHLQRLANKIES